MTHDTERDKESKIFAELQKITLEWCDDEEKHNEYDMNYIRNSVYFGRLLIRFRDYIDKRVAEARQEGRDEIVGVNMRKQISTITNKARANERTALREKVESILTKVEYDNMYCSKCDTFIKERFSHNSEDGFSECCGKKLVRKQGEAIEDTSRNWILREVLDLLNQ